MAPQILRIDMRQDLMHLELLKTWPVKASAVVRGEMLWPGALHDVLAWIAARDRAGPVVREFLTRGDRRAARRAGSGGRSWRRRWCSRSSRFTTAWR